MIHRQSQQSHRDRRIISLGIERILKRARKAAVLIDEAYYEFSGVTALPLIERVAESVRQPHVFEGLRHGGHAAGLPVFAIRPTSRFCTKRSRHTA